MQMKQGAGLCARSSSLGENVNGQFENESETLCEQSASVYKSSLAIE